MFTSSIRVRATNWIITALLIVWLLLTGYLWVTGQGRLAVFLAALLLSVASPVRTYTAFTSTLTFSPNGVRYFFSGATYVAGWDSVTFGDRRFLWRTIPCLALSRPIQPTISTLFARLTIPLLVSFIPSHTFGWPSNPLREAVGRHVEQPLHGKIGAA